MKHHRLKWRSPSRRVESTPARSEESSSSIQLPVEIWRKIISFTIRLTGATTIELDDPFGPPHLHEEYPEIDFSLFHDRMSLSLVCSSWREVVTEISTEYIVLYSGQQLKSLVKKYRSCKVPNTRRLGDRTTRIDFKILTDYNPQDAVNLFRFTPNLMIYTNKNGPSDHPRRCTPIEVLNGLVTYCGHSLRRVEWSGPGESPRLQDFAVFCNSLPNLITLRLMSIYSYPSPRDGAPPLIRLPSLKTLSLGIIPEPPAHREQYSLTWDPFLQYLSVNSQQLPSIERFECDLFPQFTMSFFIAHAHKLRQFRTTTCFADIFLTEAVAACSNLLDLVLVHGPELVAFPQYHPTLRRICILPSIDVEVAVPNKIYEHAIMCPLDAILQTIEQMIAPHLAEVRIRNSGAFVDIVGQAVWLTYWWRRWNLRGIEFTDKAGRSYQNIQDCESPFVCQENLFRYSQFPISKRSIT